MIRKSYTYDDLILEPAFSNVKSRQDVDISVQLGPYRYGHPILVANMKIMGLDMAKVITRDGGLALLHRFDDAWEQQSKFHSISNKDSVGFSLGVNRESYDDFWDLWQLTACNIWCVDIAHGDSQQAVDMVTFLKSHKGIGFDPIVIAGNVATASGARRLWRAGADAVKVGVGEGSVCSTRIQTGHGVPMMTALMNIHQERELYHPGKIIIADGGIRSAGDCVKALCFSEFVMVGNLFAGCEETPYKPELIDGKLWKKYEGSSTLKNRNIEGVKGYVPFTGTYYEVLEGLLDGIRSGCSYSGVDSVKKLQDDPQFYEVSPAALTKNGPHDIKLT